MVEIKILVLISFIGSVCAMDPMLTPETLTDSSGNSANKDSDITWANIPTFGTYSAGSITYDSNGLDPLYNFAKSFINGGVFPYGLPTDLIEKALNGTLITDVTVNYMSYLQQFGGYGACIVIGFLFIFIFPLIGCIFCCCRTCCGNCGGKMEQSRKESDSHCKRRVCSCILLVLIAFTLAGLICVFVSNDQMTNALDNIDDAVEKNLDDVSLFVNNSVDQVKYLANNNFNFTLDVLFRDLDNIGYILGIPIRTSLSTEGGVGAAIDSGFALEARVTSIATALLAVNATLDSVMTKANTLSSNLTTLKNDINTACTAPCSIDTSNLDLGFSTTDFPDISDPVSKISDVQTQNLTAVVLQAEKEFTDIPWRVQNESLSPVQDLKNMVSNFSGQLDTVIDKLVNTQDSVGEDSLGNIKTTVRDYVATAMSYNKYRFYGGIGLACIILLVVVLQFFGVAFGVLGHKNGVSPTQRGCMGTTGGNMLMASVGFVFIFSSLLMLLTTLTFIFGAPLEKFVCRTLTASDMSDLETLVDDKIYKILYPDNTEGTLLGVLLLQNESVDLKFTELLKDCQAGKAIYKAMKLDNLFDLSPFINYSNTINVTAEIDKIPSSIDLSSIEILTPDLVTQLNNLKDSLNVNFTQFRQQLNKNVTGQDLNTLASELDTAGNAASGITQTNLFNLRDRTLTIQNTTYAELMNAMTQLGVDLDALEVAVNGTATDVDSVLDNFNTTQEYLRNNASTVIGREVTTFSKRIFKVLDSYIEDTVYALNNELGTCEPVWNLYNSLIVISFCRYTVDTLNGFWFALGWCIFFFVPSIIFATKVARFYRRMTYSDDYNESAAFPSGKGGKKMKDLEVQRYNTAFLPGKNKVAHHDPAPPPYSSNW